VGPGESELPLTPERPQVGNVASVQIMIRDSNQSEGGTWTIPSHLGMVK
jgi:hypothetical protein